MAPPDGGAGVDPDAEVPPACGEESRLPEDDWICAVLGLPPVAADCPHDEKLWCTQWGCCEWNQYGGNRCAPWASDDGRVCCPYQGPEP
ncbi:MAG: hypothetical protein HY744_27470 [Deltaproteobacteria bacterium]|nr:hypothetical protein [Deltaproteobacteria bacterium]